MLTKRFTPPNKIGYSLFFFILLLVAAAGLAASLNPAQAQSGNGKYDTDGDRLIEVSSWQQLHAIHFDLDGNGSSDNDSYATAYPVGSNESVCDLSCNGYELSRSLDFDTAQTKLRAQAVGLPIRGFNATFDGNGRTISNLYLDVDRPSQIRPMPAFSAGPTVNAVIKNIGLLNVRRVRSK